MKSLPPISSGEILEIRGTKLFVRVLGAIDLPAIIVLHGGPGGSHEKLLGLSRLASKFRIVFFDQRGAGNSERFRSINPESALSMFGLDQNVEDIEVLRDRLSIEKLIVLGHSWGGALATFYAAKYPSRVDKLIVYSGGPEDRELANEKEKRHSIRRSVVENSLLKTKVKLLERAMTEGAHQESLDSVFSEIICIAYPSLYFRPPKILANPTNCGFWANFGAGAYVNSFDRREFAQRLKKIECSTLLIWGRHEPSPQERLLYLLDNISHSQFVIFENSGHNAMDEEPERFFETLELFLGNRPLSIPSFRSRDEILK